MSAKPFAVVAALVAVAVTTYTALSSGEVVEERYATWEEARLAGAVEEGWIPPFVPRSATDLRDLHDIDSNLQILRFQAPTEDLEAMVGPMTVVEGVDLPPLPQGYEIPEMGVTLYRVDGPPPLRCIAVSSAASLAVMWTCGPDDES